MLPVIFHAARVATTRAGGPPGGVLADLGGDDFLLQPRRQPLRFSQGQPQIGDITEITGAIDLHDVNSLPLGFGADLHQSQNPDHASTPGEERRENAFRRLYPQLCGSPPQRHVREDPANRICHIAKASVPPVIETGHPRIVLGGRFGTPLFCMAAIPVRLNVL